MNPIIELRPLCASDAEAFFTWAGDEKVTQNLFWNAHASVSAARSFLSDVAEKHPWFMAIIFQGVPVGAITLDQGTGRAEKRAELGYVVARKYWGQGLASAAVKLAIEQGFASLPICRIEAFVDPENHASIRVLEKGGLKNEARLSKYVVHRNKIRDRFCFAITKESV